MPVAMFPDGSICYGDHIQDCCVFYSPKLSVICNDECGNYHSNVLHLLRTILKVRNEACPTGRDELINTLKQCAIICLLKRKRLSELKPISCYMGVELDKSKQAADGGIYPGLVRPLLGSVIIDLGDRCGIDAMSPTHFPDLQRQFVLLTVFQYNAALEGLGTADYSCGRIASVPSDYC